VAVGLVAITLAVFAPVWGYGFVSWDDPWYITANPHVAGGLSWSALSWAMTTGGEFYWHPLTWLSHMLDVQLYGMNAGGHHLTSLLLHLANVVLLFGVLRRMTGAVGRSALVAALFAVHPLHVESVAWVSERKDVLSGLFWMLAMAAYIRYASAPRAGRYLAVCLMFVLGLAAKPMIVTLPVVLLLLDVWPLHRLRAGGAVAATPVRLLVEKLPLVGLALAAGVATFIVQRSVGAIGSLGAFPLRLRAANAIVSYVVYIRQAVWPAGLAAYYPYPHAQPEWWLVLGALAILVGVTAVVVRLRTSRPYLLVGWLWYLVTMAPVIGFIQAGDQLRADRFMYIPLVGLLIVVAWGAVDLAARIRVHAVVMAVAGIAATVAYASVAHAQLPYWKDSRALWTRALEVTAENHRAQAAIGDLLLSENRFSEAAGHYQEAVRIAPGSADYRFDLGVAYTREGKLAAAAAEFLAAVQIDPRHVEAQVGLGAMLARQGRFDEAIAHYTEALRVAPDHALARRDLCLALLDVGRVTDAVRECGNSARLDPASADAHEVLGLALARDGKLGDAVVELATAVRLDPGAETARVNLGVALMKLDRRDEAERTFEAALRLNPADGVARDALRSLAAGRRRPAPSGVRVVPRGNMGLP
jgi:tetratricopeptide (TPR) repeat protein